MQWRARPQNEQVFFKGNGRTGEMSVQGRSPLQRQAVGRGVGNHGQAFHRFALRQCDDPAQADVGDSP